MTTSLDNASEAALTASVSEHLSAMECSQQASKFLREERYDDSLECYQRALDLYTNHGVKQVIRMVNAAGCLRNMGAIHRLVKRYEQAIPCWQRAEDIYRECQEQCRSISSPSAENTMATPPEECLCLDSLIMETLQSRASLHLKNGNHFHPAMQCHAQVLQHLTELFERRPWEEPNASTVDLEGVSFRPIEAAKLAEHTTTSSEALVSLFRKAAALHVAIAATHVRAVAEALPILYRHSADNDEDNKKLEQRLLALVRKLSSALADANMLEQATTIVQEAVAHHSEGCEHLEWCAILDDLGQRCVDLQDYDHALECFEKALFARSQVLGSGSLEVAQSLLHVGRVMEAQGNVEGSLDLYKVAHGIYQQHLDDPKYAKQAVAVLQLVPSLMQQGDFADAITYLTKCLEIEEEQESPLDKAQIYFDLGRAYMGIHDYVSATVCLVEAAQQEGNVSEEQVFALLQRVEFLQRRKQQRQRESDEESETGRNQNPVSEEEDDLCLENVAAESNVISAEGLVDNESIESVVKETEEERLVVAEEKKDDQATKRDANTPTTMFTLSGSRASDVHSTSSSHGEGSLPADEESYQADTEQVRMVDEPSSAGDDSVSACVGHSARHSDVSSSELSSERQSAAPSVGNSIDPVPNEEAETELPTPSTPPSSLPKNADDPQESFASPMQEEFTQMGSRQTSSASKLSINEMSLQTSQEGSDLSSRKKKGRSLRFGSPRRMKSQDIQDGPMLMKSRSFTNKFRRRRRDGFESLPEEKELDSNAVLLPSELDFEEEYHTSFDGAFDGPLQFVSIRQGGGKSFDDNMSQITLMLDNPNKARERSNEWWWGVTAEGFGRWFPTSYVSKAVEAAEGFLSAKSIHSKVKSAPLHMGSDEESMDDKGSGDRLDVPSNQTSAEAKTSAAKKSEGSTGSLNRPDSDELAWAQLPRQESILTSSSPRRKKREKELKSEVERQLETVETFRLELEGDHPNLATALYDLAVLQRRCSGLEEATNSASEALQMQKIKGNLKEAANTLHLLADLAMQREKFKLALTHYYDALKMEQREYGRSSESTARTLNCIGTVRALQSEFGLAMKSHQEALLILKECHGDRVKDPLVSQTLCQIGSVYYRERNSLTTIKAKSEDYTTFIEGGMLEVIGRAHEDRGSYKMAIAFFEEKLQFLLTEDEDRSSPSEELATTLNSLGMLSARAGLYFEAIDYYERALAIQLQLGCDEVYLSTARVLTGTVQYQLGNWNTALGMLQDALFVLREELGPEHETVAATLYQVGVVQCALCQYEEAMSALQQAFATQKILLGGDHPATLRTQREIGNLYAIYEEEIDAASEQFRAVLAAQRNIHGDKHPNIAETLHSMGCAFARKGDYTNALRWLEESYYMRLEFLGVDHPLQATTLHEICKIHVARKRVKKALEICNIVLGIRKESLNEKHIDVARALATKAHCLSVRGNFNSALKYFNEALPMAEAAVGNSHPAVADMRVQMGTLYLHMCQFADARLSTTSALDLYRRSHLDEDHPGIREALELLGKIERDESLCV